MRGIRDTDEVGAVSLYGGLSDIHLSRSVVDGCICAHGRIAL